MFFHRYFIAFLLGSIVLSVGCSTTKSTNNHSSLISWGDLQVTPTDNNETLCWDVSLFDKPTWEQVKKDFSTGLVIGLNMPDAKEIGYQTYEIMSELPMEAEINIWYGGANSRPAEIRFFVVLDERQADVFTSSQYYDDIVILPGSEVTIPIRIPYLSSGIHDLIVIGIPYLNEYPNPEGMVRVLSHRVTLVVPPIKLKSPFRQIDFANMSAKGLISRGDPKIPLMLSLSDNELKVWDWPNEWLSTETGTIDFFILSGYESVTNLDAPYLLETENSFFALILFVDYQQVEIEYDKLVVYGKVSSDTAYATIQARVKIQEGKHHILAIKINNPGIPMCILYGPPNGRILPNNVNGVLHGVDVASNK